VRERAVVSDCRAKRIYHVIDISVDGLRVVKLGREAERKCTSMFGGHAYLERMHPLAVAAVRLQYPRGGIHARTKQLRQQDEKDAFIPDPGRIKPPAPASSARRRWWKAGGRAIVRDEGSGLRRTEFICVDGQFGGVGVGAVEGRARTKLGVWAAWNVQLLLAGWGRRGEGDSGGRGRRGGAWWRHGVLC